MTVMTPPTLDQEDEEMLVPHSDFNDGPQPLDVVAQGETVSTAENQTVEEPPSTRFTWTIENFSRLNLKKHYSDIFLVGGYKWRILIFPKGNNADHLSLYLDVADSATLPYGWSRYAQFSLAVINQIHNKYSIRKDTQHQFNARESDWGFTSFMPLGELYDPGKGFIVNDTCILEAEVAVRKVVDYWTYDSKKETGYVGLKNQGATCYMNSLLQTLYHIRYFRKAVYHMPTTENDMPSGSIPLALQSLFYKLQYSDNSVATKELTKSFGWDTYDSFMQHDVQELNRVLCEKLEDKMKGTVVEGAIQQLFEGHHMNYIECINVDYKSTRKESFYDLQLDVKGCRDVYASFDKYVEVERLEGDNKYHAEQHGLQDAKKGVLFIDFPPVLQLQLKRFEYDFMRDTMVKINDRYEFPLQLDLDRENGKYLSPDADRSVRNLYTLHSVLVHSGGVHGGHYYAFIRPTLSDQWYKFDDERVTKEDTKRALEEQYGGEEELPQANPGFNNTPFKFTKYSNAYMLVYIRESDKEKIICNVDEKDIAEHLRIRLKKEQEEKEHKKKEKAEAHLYTIIKVARDEDLSEQIGKDIYFDLVDHDKVRSFRIQKQLPFSLFKEEVAKEFGIPVQYQRFWLWAKRQNHTYRPNRPLTQQEELQSVGQLREVSNKSHNAELKLLLEVEFGMDCQPFPPPDKTREDILLFFKLYDPEKEELRYVGRLFVKAGGKPVEILTRLNEMAGFPSFEEIELYELMSNPGLVKLATEGMKNMRQDDVRNAAEQLKYARSEDMAGMAENIAKATPEEIAAMRAQADAQITYELNACEVLKKQGNDFHGHGKYRDAAQKYLLAKENLKVPVSQGKKLQLACSLNLMSCFLQMKQYEDCVKEGTEVLQYDAQNVKALYRRGQAYKELGNMKAAVSDLSKASTISPDDETITDVLRQTKELLKEHEEPRTSGVVIEEIIEQTESSTSDTQENHLPKEYSVLQPEDTAEKSQVHNRSAGSDSSGFNVDAQRLQELKDNPEAIRSFLTFLANANPDALAAIGGPGMAPEMVKTMSNMVSKMSAEELQKMLEVAPSLNGTNPLFRPSTSAATESQTSVAAPSVRDNREASTSSSRSTSMGSEMPPSYNPTGDVQEQMRNQMRDPAMRQTFQMIASMIKNMNPEMMANMSEQFGFKLSMEDAVKAQQAMSSLSSDDLERMVRWADKILKVAEGARKTKNWLLGRKGLILAIAMLIWAVILHWMVKRYPNLVVTLVLSLCVNACVSTFC